MEHTLKNAVGFAAQVRILDLFAHLDTSCLYEEESAVDDDVAIILAESCAL